jgi:hypothetical protein
MLLQVIGDGETLDLRGESHGIEFGIEIPERLDPTHAASSLPHIAPEGIDASAERGHCPQPRNDNVTAMLIHQSDPLLMLNF